MVGAAEAGVPVLVAYPWRYWPPLLYVKQLLDEGRIGRVLSARTVYGCHFEHHMPHHAERPDSYLRSLGRGGGCLLEMSHAIDYLRWLCGTITEVSGVVEMRELNMAADDCADMLVQFMSGAMGAVSLSLFLPAVTGWLDILGERGRITWDREHGVLLNTFGAEHLSHRASPPELNEMYLAEARHFLAVVEGKETPRCDAWDGYQTMRVISAARKASEEKRWVDV